MTQHAKCPYCMGTVSHHPSCLTRTEPHATQLYETVGMGQHGPTPAYAKIAAACAELRQELAALTKVVEVTPLASPAILLAAQAAIAGAEVCVSQALGPCPLSEALSLIAVACALTGLVRVLLDSGVGNG